MEGLEDEILFLSRLLINGESTFGACFNVELEALPFAGINGFEKFGIFLALKPSSGEEATDLLLCTLGEGLAFRCAGDLLIFGGLARIVLEART